MDLAEYHQNQADAESLIHRHPDQEMFQENRSVCLCTFDELGFVIHQCLMNYKFYLLFEEPGLSMNRDFREKGTFEE
uniref:Uncharacterized protein n=1 Tax=Romanomermis culicivorax TaxID=13658 RepID=A0A915HXJ1_ROMCU